MNIEERFKVLASMYINDTCCDGQLFCGCRKEDCENFKTEDCVNCLIKHTEEQIKEHTQITFLDDFLKKHPNASLDEYGVPYICPYALGYFEKPKETCLLCNTECVKCWHQPLKAAPNIIGIEWHDMSTKPRLNGESRDISEVVLISTEGDTIDGLAHYDYEAEAWYTDGVNVEYELVEPKYWAYR